MKEKKDRVKNERQIDGEEGQKEALDLTLADKTATLIITNPAHYQPGIIELAKVFKVQSKELQQLDSGLRKVHAELDKIMP